MSTSYPLRANPLQAVPLARPPVPRAPAPVALGAWRYDCLPRSRVMLFSAAVISISVHVGIFFGFGPTRKKAAPPREVSKIQLVIEMPKLEELDEPETVASDDDVKPDLGQPVPMQADVPSAVLPTDFVQQFDFASLIERPDLKMSLLALPDSIRRPGKLMDGVKIFDLAALDRVPEAVVQPAPIYPVHLRKDALTVAVRVEFLVDTDGRVFNAIVVSSDNPAFNEAATLGVMKWRFRAGVKNGRKVITRMTVPIIFKVVALLD